MIVVVMCGWVGSRCSPETKKTSAEVLGGEVGLSSRSSARSRIARWRHQVGGRCRDHRARPYRHDRAGQAWRGKARLRRRAARRRRARARIRSRIERIPTTLPSSTTGRWRKPPWIISTAACSAGLVRLDRLRAARHPVADDRLGREPLRDGAQDVALGEHADEALVLEHEGGSDAPLVHLPHGLDERRRRLDREQVAWPCARRREACARESTRFPAEFLGESPSPTRELTRARRS